MFSSNKIILEAKNISKYFGTITALENVNLSVREGECLGVVGDNGAGKTTLMKVLSGLYKPSKGDLYFNGNKEILESPRDSQNLGLEMVYQDLALAGNLPIGENIFLGREPTKNLGFFKMLDYKKIKEMSEAHLEKLKIHVKSADQKVEELSGGQRQAIAIARATAFNSKLVIMDEPTAALAIKEVGKVLDLINGLKKIGVSVIIISHRMDDIFAVCDRVTALFQGTNFAESELSKTSRDEVIGWIMGKKINMDNKKEVKKDSLFLKAIPYFDKYGILILLLIMIIALHIMQPEVFLSWRNITNVFKQISWQSMLALGVFIVIVTAGIDLSVGSIMMLSLMVLAITSKAGAAWYVVILIPIFIGALCGMVNGFGITVLRMPHPFIMTLGTLYIFRGTGNLISGGVPISGFTEEVRLLGNGRIDLTWLGLEKSQYLPVSVILIAVVFFLMWVFLNHTRTGKWIYAIGGNPNAARAAGINVNRILVIVYSLCGLLAGFGALILAGRTDSGYPNAGLNAELDAIAACIIGGASFFGGRGTVLGVFAGVMIMGLLRNGLNLMDVSSFWQQVLIGTIIVLAVYIDVLRKDLGTRK